ncbi:MAG: carboxypeptidase-like regulatory domain-containing protein [Flavobacteriia bacterium]|nr:carboxypeptidase-like regulatory domain-containing protein [Flavobacteriia bacterium]
MFRTIIFLFILVSIFSTYYSQVYQVVSGKVFDQETKTPISGAKVFIYKKDSTIIGKTLTLPDGSFQIQNISIGKHQLKVSYLGYENKSLAITVNSGKQVILEIPLSETLLEQEEVKVVARKKGETINELGMVSSKQFSVEETERYAGSRSDPARMASNFAGVQGADDSRNDIIIRGNSPLGVVWRIEGIDIPNPNHFAVSGSTGGPVSIINNKLLSNSDFFMSAFPAEYGNSISGIFDLKLRNGNNQQYEFTGQLGFLGTEWMAEGPLKKNGKSSFLWMGRYSTLSLFNSMGVKIGTDAVPIYGDMAFKTNHVFKKGGILSIFGIGGKSKIAIKISDQTEYSKELYGEGDRDQYFGTAMGVIGMNYKKTLKEKTFISNTFSYSYEEQNAEHDFLVRHLDTVQEGSKEKYLIKIDSIYPLMAYTFKISRVSHFFSLTHKFSKKHLIKWGLNNEFQLYAMNDSVLDPSHSFFVKRWDNSGHAFFYHQFIQWKWRMTEKMDFTLGLHAQYYSLSNHLSPAEPRIAWKFKANKGNVISAGVGLHSQTQPIYTYLYFKKDVLGGKILHNREMGFSKSIHTVIAHEKNFLKNLQLKTEIYYQYLYQIPVSVKPSAYSLINQGSGFARFFPDSLKNTGTGYNVGIEITLQKYFDKSFYFLLSSSLYQSKYKGSDGIERNSAYNGNYTVNFLVGKEFSIKEKQVFSIGLKSTLAGGRRYGYVDEASSKYLNELIFKDSLLYERQFRPYYRLDLKINWRLNTKKMTHEIGIDLVNILNTKNLLGLTYSPDLANPSAEPIAEKQQLGFLPIFYYKLDFYSIKKN